MSAVKAVGIYMVFTVNNVIPENKKHLMKITPAANKANCRSADYFKGSKLKIRVFLEPDIPNSRNYKGKGYKLSAK